MLEMSFEPISVTDTPLEFTMVAAVMFVEKSPSVVYRLFFSLTAFMSAFEESMISFEDRSLVFLS